MAPDPADPATAILAGIRKHHHPGSPWSTRKDCCIADSQEWPCDTATLLETVERVLQLADETDNYGRTRSPVARATASLIRKRITAALTGAQPGAQSEASTEEKS